MEKPEKQKPQESKVAVMMRMLEEACKKNGWRLIDREPNREVFTVSFKRRNET